MNTQHVRSFNLSRCIYGIAVLILLTGLLAGCGSAMAFSAHDAAMKAVLTDAGHLADVDPNSVQLLQSLQMGEKTFVLIAFEGVQPGLPAKSKCMYLYDVEKNPFGMWAPHSGGGGCETQLGPDMVLAGQSDKTQPDPAITPQPISIQSSQTSTDKRGDMGHSTVSGRTFDEAIQSVKVTWADNTTQQVDVINASYLFVRDGLVDMSSVEALDAQGNSVFIHRSEFAPSKK